MVGTIACIKRLKVKDYVFFAAIVLVLGSIIRFFFFYPNYLFYQVMLTSIIIVTVIYSKKFWYDFQNLRGKIATDPKLHVLYSKAERAQYSPYILLGTLLFTGVYVSIMFILGYLEFNIVGIYALILILITCLTGTLAYGQYIVLLVYIFRLSGTKVSVYNYYFPAHTEWLKELAKITRMVSNVFFVLGTMYTCIWMVLIPKGTIKIILTNGKLGGFKLLLTSNSNTLFAVSWIGIFLLFIVAFPLLHILQRKLIKMITKRMKENTMGELQLLLNSTINLGKNNIEGHMKYFSLIKEVGATPDYPLETKSYLPIVMSLASLLIQLIKIGESFS